jgi:hypothetical protein
VWVWLHLCCATFIVSVNHLRLAVTVIEGVVLGGSANRCCYTYSERYSDTFRVPLLRVSCLFTTYRWTGWLIQLLVYFRILSSRMTSDLLAECTTIEASLLLCRFISVLRGAVHGVQTMAMSAYVTIIAVSQASVTAIFPVNIIKYGCFLL